MRNRRFTASQVILKQIRTNNHCSVKKWDNILIQTEITSTKRRQVVIMASAVKGFYRETIKLSIVNSPKSFTGQNAVKSLLGRHDEFSWSVYNVNVKFLAFGNCTVVIYQFFKKCTLRYCSGKACYLVVVTQFRKNYL